MVKNMNYYKYLDEYNDAIFEFVWQEKEAWKSIEIKTKEPPFFKSFYEVAWSMLDNGKDLSDKQIKIIEREMTKKGIKIPKPEDYNFSIKIDFSLEIDGEMFYERWEFGQLIIAITEGKPEFISMYEDAFESGTHMEKYHKEAVN